VSEFLNVIFDGVLDEEHKIDFRILDPAKSGPVSHFTTADTDVVYKYISEHGWSKGHHVFFGVVPRPIEGVQCLWADLDGSDFGGGKEQAKVAAEEAFPLKPSIVVDSGHGYHLYWRLKSLVDPAQAEEVMKSLEDVLNGDSTSDPTRFLRLPGTQNPKDPRVLCQIETLRPEKTYALEDFKAAFRVPPRVMDRIRSESHKGYKSRSERDWFVTTALVQTGLRNSLIKEIFYEWPIGNKVREEPGDHYIEYTIAKAHESLRHSTRTTSEAEARFYIEDDDSLWSVRDDQDPRRASTFWFEPQRVIESGDGDILEGTIHAHEHTWPGERLEKHAFDSARNLKAELRLGSWCWFGSDKDTQLYLEYIMRKLEEDGMPRAQGEIAIGRHGDFWVSPGMTFTRDEVFSPAEAPIAFVDRGLEYPDMKYSFESEDMYRELCRDIFTHFEDLVNPQALWTIAGWNFAAPLKPLLFDAGIRFPHLDLYGTRGSGKTTIIRNIFQPLLGAERPTYHDCQTTAFVLLGLLSSTNSFPVLLAEFHRSILPQPVYNRLLRTLKLAYDSGFDSRGRPNQTIEEYPLTAPIILDGEDALSDAAVQERSIIVNLSPEDVMEGTSAHRAYKALTEMDLHRFAGNFIRYTLEYTEDDAKALYLEARGRIMNAFPEKLPDRVRSNICVVGSGLVLLERYANRVGFDVPNFDADFLRERLFPALEAVVDLEHGRTRTLADALIEDLVNHLELCGQNRWEVPFFARYNDEANEIWFQLASAHNWWLAQRRRRGLAVLDDTALTTQLQERFVARRGGVGQYILEPKSVRIGGSVQWAYGVDVDKALEAGLDIPATLTPKDTLIVNISSKGSAK
jgi:hypothetical protein